VTAAPSLLLAPADASPFRAHLSTGRGGVTVQGEVVQFRNLGGDALLVVPTPPSAGSCAGTDAANWREGCFAASHAHLAAFVRGSAQRQQRSLWAAVATASLAALTEDRTGQAPLWVSTSGVGVSWLHVRLDASPKYYVQPRYRQFPFAPL
jgi:hypothetical protein